MDEKVGPKALPRFLPAAPMLFPVNLHALDRLARMVLGVLMMVIGWNAEAGVVAFVLRLFAFYPLITGLVGWDPIYALLRFRTNK